MYYFFKKPIFITLLFGFITTISLAPILAKKRKPSQEDINPKRTCLQNEGKEVKQAEPKALHEQSLFGRFYTGVSQFSDYLAHFFEAGSPALFYKQNPTCDTKILEQRITESSKSHYQVLDLSKLNLEVIDHIMHLIPQEHRGKLKELNLAQNPGLKQLPQAFKNFFIKQSDSPVIINVLETGLFSDQPKQAIYNNVTLLRKQRAHISCPAAIHLLINNPLCDLDVINDRLDEAQRNDYKRINLSELKLVNLKNINLFLIPQEKRGNLQVLNLSKNKDLKQITLDIKKLFAQEQKCLINVTETGLFERENHHVQTNIVVINTLKSEGFEIVGDDINKKLLFLLDNPACDHKNLEARFAEAEYKEFNELDLHGLQLSNVDKLFSLIPQEKIINIQRLNLSGNSLSTFCFSKETSAIAHIDLSDNKELKQIAFTSNQQPVFEEDDERKPVISFLNTSLFPKEDERLRACQNYKIVRELKMRNYNILSNIQHDATCTICLANKPCGFETCCGARICAPCCKALESRRCSVYAKELREKIPTRHPSSLAPIFVAGRHNSLYASSDFEDTNPGKSHLCLSCHFIKCHNCRNESGKNFVVFFNIN